MSLWMYIKKCVRKTKKQREKNENFFCPNLNSSFRFCSQFFFKTITSFFCVLNTLPTLFCVLPILYCFSGFFSIPIYNAYFWILCAVLLLKITILQFQFLSSFLPTCSLLNMPNIICCVCTFLLSFIFLLFSLTFFLLYKTLHLCKFSVVRCFFNCEKGMNLVV